MHKGLILARHPNFLATQSDWEKWRLCYEGGANFRDSYLEKITSREHTSDFNTRRALTPIPTFAKSAVNDIRNSIFQRMTDITRQGGSQAYQLAVNGKERGVDNRGKSMNAFIGQDVLTDLLVMGMVGVFIDMPTLAGPTLADSIGKRPYLYMYKRENILSWRCSRPEEPSEFQSLLLKDTCLQYDKNTGLPLHTFERFRLLWMQDGRVNLQFFDEDENPVDQNGNPSGSVQLGLTRIPFVMLDIGDSLLKDVCEYQITLLNLISLDVNFAIQANFPFYVEQADLRPVGQHLKHSANPDGTATQGGQQSSDKEIKVGPTQGRRYHLNTDQPTFINPSSETLEASLKLQEKLEADIRKLVNLAVQTLASRASAESKEMDNQGLEAGLSFIGLVLENAEREIAEHWAAYESVSPRGRSVATIKYPDRYSLKTDKDRIEEAEKLAELIFKVPSREAKKEIHKAIVLVLLQGKIEHTRIKDIFEEIDLSEFTTSDPETILSAVQGGIWPERIAAAALGLPEDAYLEARKDHAERIARIQEAQTSNRPAARGNPDLDPNPQSGKEEKSDSRDTTFKDSTKTPVRGEGQ